jgi:hypothetical protein
VLLPDELRHLYIDRKLSMLAIYRLAGVSDPTIKRMLVDCGIALRSRGEQASIALGERQRDDRELPQRLVEIIVGEMLGDGCLVPGKYQARYSHGSTDRRHMEWLSGEFGKAGIVCRVSRMPARIDKRGRWRSEQWNIVSRSMMALRRICDEWYIGSVPNRIKVLPEDLVLSPLAVRQWWIGDGYINPEWGWGTLATHGFTHGENMRLKSLLSGITSHHIAIRNSGKAAPGKYHLYLSRKAVNDLVSHMGPCEIESYSYKWATKGDARC